jgi:ferredoxin
MRATRRDAHLRVAPIDCHAHGICAELLPELIGLDEWGYPLLVGGPVPDELIRTARRAAAACPTLPLKLVRSGPGHTTHPRP